MVYGIAAISFSLVALASPLGAAIAMAWVIGILALSEGIVLLIAQPLIGMIITTIWIGAIVLVYDIFQIMAGIQLRKL